MPENSSVPTDDLKVGDIVEIVASSNEAALGCLGEVLELGPPVRVAVVHVVPYQVDEIKKHFDVTSFSWNELRKQAKHLGLLAKGTRPELEATMKRRLMDRGRVELRQPTSHHADDAVAARDDGSDHPRFAAGEFVRVVRDASNPAFVGATGTVIDPGPPLVDVELVGAEVGFQTVNRKYAERDLELLN